MFPREPTRLKPRVPTRKQNAVKKEVAKKKKPQQQKKKQPKRRNVRKVIPELKEIDKQTGFGWNGRGSRRIVFDEILNEYRYEVLDPLLTYEEKELKDRLIEEFRRRVDIDVFEIEPKKKLQVLEEALQKICDDLGLELKGSVKDRVYYYIFQEFTGFGKIDVLMHDPEIEDISCDGPRIPVFVFHRTHESIRTNVVFDEAEELDSYVIKLSQMCGKQISVYEPIVDGKFSDGSRLQTTLGQTITPDSTFTIRKFRADPLTPVDLVANNTMSAEMAAYFWMAIEQGASILFCGGTATGKTTMLNALSLFVPSAYKIVSIEDTREINLPHENWIAGTTRVGFSTSEANKTSKDIDMFDLIRVALRQRPRVIIVGEVRGREAYTLFQAMTTGHLSYSTVHASDMHSLIKRLESPPISLPRALLTSLDLIVFLNSVTVQGIPVRRVTNVTEVIKLDLETNRLVTMTPFSWQSEIDDHFRKNNGSRIMQKCRDEQGFNEHQLAQELTNRMTVLNWMVSNKKRSYTDVGRIVSEYSKNPTAVLKMVSGGA